MTEVNISTVKNLPGQQTRVKTPRARASNTTSVWVGVALLMGALLLRLPYLGSFLTVDEVKWAEGSEQFLRGLVTGDMFQTYWHFHPGITITWGAAFLLWLRWLVTGGELDLVSFAADQVSNLPDSIGWLRLSPAILTSLTVMGLYWLARPLTGSLAALLGAGLLAASPFFVAHSRIVNGDAAAAGFMILAFLAFARLWQSQRYRWAMLAGGCAGLAILTKLPAPIILPWFAILAGLGLIRQPNWRFWLTALLLTGLAAGLIFVLLWPAMWVAPIETLRLMYRDSFEVGDVGAGQETFFLGHVSNDPGWFFYPYALAFRLTPLVLIGTGLAVFWLVRPKQNQAQPARLLIVALLLYIGFVVIAASFSPKKLDRYAMAVIPALTLLAGLGFARTFTWLTSPISGAKRWLLPVVAFLILIGQGLFVITNYPYVLTYYNPWLGGYAGAVERVPVGWGEGLEQAAAWINQQPQADSVRVSSWYGDIVQPYLHSHMSSFSSSGKGQLGADYVIFYINQRQRQKPSAPVINYFARQEPVFQVNRDDTPYVWVYRAPRMQVEAKGHPTIEGRAELMGYSLQPNSELTAGSIAQITLFFNPTGLLPENETFRVTVEQAGQPWGDWLPDVENRWDTDTLIEWRGQLTLPFDTPLGQYDLTVQLIDTNLNSEVTRFSLEAATLSITAPAQEGSPP